MNTKKACNMYAWHCGIHADNSYTYQVVNGKKMENSDIAKITLEEADRNLLCMSSANIEYASLMKVIIV